MFKKVISSIAAALCVSAASFAQLPCNTDTHYQKMLQQYPQLAEYEAKFNAQIKQRIAERTTSAGIDTTTYDIPLVIHVVHDYGDENIADTVLYQAAAYWAVVYVEQNADTSDVITPFKPYVGNPKIRLHLATIDPNGNPTKGVVRVQSYLTNDADDEAKFGQWPPNKYVNVWFINQFGSEDAGAAAYAYYPSSAEFMPYYDGVIGLYSYANYDKAIPHEIGHVLNLEHPWGNTNQPGVACGDDGVDDTPPTMGHEPVGCVASALYDVTCAGNDTVTYISSTGADSVYHYPDTTNAQNIMDYTYCQKMFTKQQVFRMRTALVSTIAQRNNLITPANLAATGALAPMPDLPPVADYIVDKGYAPTFTIFSDTRSYFLAFNSPASFTFRNASWNDTISSVSWSFSNGASTPTSAATGTLHNQFSVPGWVTVTLTATSNAGSGTIVNDHAVYAADTTTVGGLGYTQPFANTSAISNWPMFNYYNNQFKWEFYTGASHSSTDNSCIRYRSFDSSQRLTGKAQGDMDDFYTPAFNLTGAPGDLYFNFFTSGATLSSSAVNYPLSATGDSLEIDVTTSGGEKWVKLAGFNAAELANNGTLGNEFMASAASAWVPRGVEVPAAYRTNNAFFRFRYYPGNIGDNLYLDDMSVGQFPASVSQVLNTPNAFSIYPNPAANGCNMVFKTGNDGIVSYIIKDITGKTVFETTKTFIANSTQQEAVSRSITPNAGMYFVTVTIDGVQMTQKLVVY